MAVPSTPRPRSTHSTHSLAASTSSTSSLKAPPSPTTTLPQSTQHSRPKPPLPPTPTPSSPRRTRSSPLPRRRASALSTLRGKQAIFTSWLITSPFVSSFVEDASKGTAKKTRENTLANRHPSSPPDDALRPRSASDEARRARPSAKLDGINRSHSCSVFAVDKETSDGTASPRRCIAFSRQVRVYKEHKDEPCFEDVKVVSATSSLEARRMKSARTICHGGTGASDPSAPTSSAGKWLLRNSAKEPAR